MPDRATTLFLGAYTDDAHPNGLRTLALDETTGQMAVTAEYPVSNALYQALSPDGRVLYSCTGRGLASFRVEGARLAKVDEVEIGTCVCHVAALPDGEHVVFADYLGGFAGSVQVSEGRFGEIVRHQHRGSGPNLPRQGAAHCHQALPTPDGKSYCVVDLGMDEIVTYPGRCVFKTLPAGAGPRHLLFHPNGRLAFLVSELGNLVTSLRWNAADGFAPIDTLPTLPPGDTGRGANGDLAAAIRFTPDGKRIVVSNRGENSLVAYDFDETTGRLRQKARTLLPGNWPRDFVFVGDALALVALERSGTVLSLRYDADGGTFHVVSTLAGLFRPVALTPSGKGKNT